MAHESDPIQLELMKHVERAVRPVVAPLARKMRVRKELLSHLSDLYEQELARAGDCERATTSAMKRLGEPRELTPELQATVPWFERWEGRVGVALQRRPEESTVRYALRQSIGMASLVLLMMALLCVVVGMEGAMFVATESRGLFLLLRLSVTLVVGYFIGTFVFVLLGHGIGGIIRSGLNRWRACAAAIGLALPGGLVAFLIVGAMFVAITGRPAVLVEEFHSIWALLLAAPAVLLWVAIAVNREQRHAAKWTELVIDAG